VGFGEALGNVDATVSVPITIHTITSLNTFAVDLDFPSDLIRYDSTAVGNLAIAFDNFSANLHPNGHLLRVAGWETGPDSIPAGTTGELAVHYFTIIDTGCDTMCIDALWDGIDESEGYHACVFGAVSVADASTPASWGRIKSWYR
jgi:hypothetical protein